METTATKAENVATTLDPAAPARILVRSLTHLVPGEDYFDKCDHVYERICRLHWNCGFDYRIHRGVTHGAKFAFENRTCYFLLDFGRVPENGSDDDVPILSYEWTGESLEPKPELAEDKYIRRKLRKYYPFTYRPKSESEPESDPVPMRLLIRYHLHQMTHLNNTHLKHVREHPEDAKWLKENLEPRFWQELEKQLDRQERVVSTRRITWEEAEALGAHKSWRAA